MTAEGGRLVNWDGWASRAGVELPRSCRAQQEHHDRGRPSLSRARRLNCSRGWDSQHQKHIAAGVRAETRRWGLEESRRTVGQERAAGRAEGVGSVRAGSALSPPRSPSQCWSLRPVQSTLYLGLRLPVQRPSLSLFLPCFTELAGGLLSHTCGTARRFLRSSGSVLS